MKIERTVFLIGFMGCGKTFWGTRMSEKTGIPFYDLDVLIEAQEGISVQEIFSVLGESAFRQIEQKALQACDALGPAIISTGGGTPCFFDNIDRMNNSGLSIYLKTPAALLAERLKKEQLTRPLLARVPAQELEAYIGQLLEQRAPFYSKATVILEQNGDNPHFEAELTRAILS